jgi:hypothetical protein
MMNRLFERLTERAPDFYKRRQIARLCRGAAEAFARPAPSFRGLRARSCRQVFAEFVRGCVEDAGMRGSDLESIQSRLFQFSFHLGKKLKRRMRISEIGEAMRIIRILYRWLEIDFEFADTGEVTIRRCFFSRFFSPLDCRILSAMDRGILAGMTSGGELTFYQKITDGHPSCRARFVAAPAVVGTEERGRS